MSKDKQTRIDVWGAGYRVRLHEVPDLPEGVMILEEPTLGEGASVLVGSVSTLAELMQSPKGSLEEQMFVSSDQCRIYVPRWCESTGAYSMQLRTANQWLGEDSVRTKVYATSLTVREDESETSDRREHAHENTD